MNQQDFRNLVSGRRKDPIAWLLRLLLALPAIVYSLAIRSRNLLYNKGLLKISRTSVPVISIGNLTTGGTGKTPLVVWLANYLASTGARVAVLTRGYKTDPASTIAMDEPAILAQSCPAASVVVNPDRVAGASEAVRIHGAGVLVMDDGFQHRRLARDLDIVTIDAICPFGFGRILPAGLLREPISGLKRAQAAVITRSDRVDQDHLDDIESRLRKQNQQLVIAHARHLPVSVTDNQGDEIDLSRLNGKRIFAFCGIGNPEGFFATIRNLGCQLVGSLGFDDHHHYSRDCLAGVCGQALKTGAELILTTEKDWISSPFGALPATTEPPSVGQYALPFAYLTIELNFTAGRDALTSLIEATLAGTMPAGN